MSNESTEQTLWGLPPLVALPEGAHVLIFSETVTGRAPVELLVPDLSGLQPRSPVLDGLVNDGVLHGGGGHLSIDCLNGEMFDYNGRYSVLLGTRVLCDAAGNDSLDWSLHRQIDSRFQMSIDWDGRILCDTYSNPVVWWENDFVVSASALFGNSVRFLQPTDFQETAYFTDGIVCFNWSDTIVFSSSGVGEPPLLSPLPATATLADVIARLNAYGARFAQFKMIRTA